MTMDMYQEILTSQAVGEGYKRILKIENPLHVELTDISTYISKCFTILHVKFGYEKAVSQFNSVLLRITDVYDIDICELSEDLNEDTLMLVTVLVISGYEEILLRELVKYVIMECHFGGFLLKPQYKF